MRMTRKIYFISLYRIGQFILDGFLAFISCYLAFILRFEGESQAIYENSSIILSLVAIPGRILVNACFGIYRQIWRLFGLKDATSLFQSITFYSLSLIIITRLVIPTFMTFKGIPLGVAILDWSLCLLGMLTIRYGRRWLLEQQKLNSYDKNKLKKRALLIGAGVAGAQIVREIRQNPVLNLDVVGFLDDDITKIGRTVEGVQVFGKSSDLVKFAENLAANVVIISMPSASADQIKYLVELSRDYNLKLQVLPASIELFGDRSLTHQIRDISIQDILGRPEVKLDFRQTFNNSFPSSRDQIYQRTVLVTGAGGTIGSEICRQIAGLQPKQLLLLGRGENSIFNIEQELSQDFSGLNLKAIIADVRNQSRMKEIFHNFRPDIVFHAAAHKHVPLMEHNPIEAIENNTLASAFLAQLSTEYQVKTFVLISTDKAVDPCNFMGVSKRLAEFMVKSAAADNTTRFLVVRFGNVLGSRGSVVPIFKKQISRGGPVTVTDVEMTRYFMTTPEASQLVIQSLAVGESGQTLILDMGNPVKIIELAQQMIKLAGFRPDIDIPVKITGLRPGEKLHESLVATTEKIVNTPHPKIMAITNNIYPANIRSKIINQLTEATQSKISRQQLWESSNECLDILKSNYNKFQPDKK
jgi:FlaA1/EpsC-like NDP-sugar epimerase